MQLNRSRPRLGGPSPSQWSWRPRIERLEDRAVPTNLPPGFTETVFASGLTDATCMTFTPEGRAFVCKLQGDLRVVQPGGTVNSEPFLHVDVDSAGEHGLLGVALDPDFSGNRYLYVYYMVAAAPIHARVSRFTASATNPDVAEPGSEVVLLELDNTTDTVHVGGDLHFGRDGKLYISTGDDGDGANAQNGTNLHGKMLRINPDGSVPSDNPFVGIAGVREEIYAFGVRNAYRFAVRPNSNFMYLNDVGSSEPQAKEEVNRLWYGGNYGWPLYEGVSNDPDYTDPVLSYDHGIDPETGGFNCAITGALFYGPGARPFPRRFLGDYFYADLCGNWIRSYDPNSGQLSVFASDTDDLTVALAEDFKGTLYYLGLGGTIHRIKYSAALPLPVPGTDFTAGEMVGSQIDSPAIHRLNRQKAADSTMMVLGVADSAKPDEARPAGQRTPTRVQLDRESAVTSQLVDVISQIKL